MFRRPTINSEEFIFYLDLEGEFIKKKNIIKSINNFIKEKEKFNSATSYGVILFQSDDNPITTYNEKDSEEISNIINEKWESREKSQSYFENGLFEALSYIFLKSREARKNYRVIVISDTPSTLSEEYHNALYDLLLKARYFNTFIDILRLGEEKFYDDDVKLKVITSETHGGVFYCNEARLFQDILISLVQNKSEFTVIQPDEQNPILKEDKIFYEKLAVDLISLDSDDGEVCDICEREMCPICEAYSDEVHKCFNCNARYHACCAAEYSIANPVGFKHLFRCIQCDTLLKLEEDFVELIYKEEHEEVNEDIYDEKVKEEYIDEEMPLEELEGDREEEFERIEGEEILNTEQEEKLIEEIKLELPSLRKPPSLRPPSHTPPKEEEVIEKKVRIGGYFGQEIMVKAKTSNNISSLNTHEAIVSVANGNAQIEEKISITSLKPPKKTTIKLCKICGTTLSNISKCPTCGARVD
jgi:hypothetical protein